MRHENKGKYWKNKVLKKSFTWHNIRDNIYTLCYMLYSIFSDNINQTSKLGNFSLLNYITKKIYLCFHFTNESKCTHRYLYFH